MIRPYKGRTFDPDRPVRVYRNLGHESPEAFSVMQRGLVVGHADRLVLGAARPVVSAAGRARVLRTKRKNVHAFIEGHVLGDHMAEHVLIQSPLDRTQWVYRPDKAGHFYEPHLGQEVTYADVVLFRPVAVESVGTRFGRRAVR